MAALNSGGVQRRAIRAKTRSPDAISLTCVVATRWVRSRDLVDAHRLKNVTALDRDYSWAAVSDCAAPMIATNS